MSRALVARMDSLGDVLLTGPTVRAVAASSDRVTYLCGPTGAPGAQLLPGVDEVIVDRAGWIDADPLPVSRPGIDALTDRIAALQVDVALVLTSFHQSPLPMALVLRMAGVRRIGAISVDYPGSLLDVRHLVDDGIHEVQRSLSLANALGYRLPPGDNGALHVSFDRSAPFPSIAASDYLVVHPGASVSARAWPAERYAELVDTLSSEGWPVVVTGGTAEKQLTARVAGDRAMDLGGRLDLPALASVIEKAQAIVVANTGPAHLAAAVGTPVASLYAPTVPAQRWRPWMVPHVLLGDQSISCAGCRARVCPVLGHPCIDAIDTGAVLEAVRRLTAAKSPWPSDPFPLRIGARR